MLSSRALAVGSMFLLVGCQCQRPNTPDAGPDAGPVDSGIVADAGTFDGGALDGGIDSGVVDAGAPDAGDAGPADAGPVDAGPADAGPVDAGPADAGFCEAYDRALCGWFARCGQLDAPQTEDCVALQEWNCNQTQIDALVDGGKIAFGASIVPACLQGITASSCTRSFPASSACNGLFAPATQVGGTCTRQWSTACSGSYCQGTACPAQCSAYVPVGAGCSGDEGDQCGPAAYCAFGTPRTCTGYLPNGAACTQNDRCAGGICDTVQNKCLAYSSQQGDAGCGSDSVCTDGLYCKSGNCTPSEVLGGPCRLYGGADCSTGFTCRISDGGTTGDCQPSSGVDGGCYGLPADCLPGLLCDSAALFAPGTCLTYRSEGEPCVRSIQNCKVGLLCDQTTLLCRRLPKVGEPCVRDPGNFRSSDCVGGFCPPDAGADGGRSCAAPQPAGAVCDRPWECASSECNAGRCDALCTGF